MRGLAVLAVVLVAAMPARADVGFFIGTGKFAGFGGHYTGNGVVGARTRGISRGVTRGVSRGVSAAQIRSRAQGRTGPALTLGQRARLDSQIHKKFRPWRKRYRYNPIFYGDTIREETIVVVNPPAPPAPPEPEVVAEPAPPPDPRGPRFTPARGVVPAGPKFAVGAPLPRRQPFVTLDWRRFDLPEPDIGREYVRMGRDVLLIDSSSRIVIETVDAS